VVTELTPDDADWAADLMSERSWAHGGVRGDREVVDEAWRRSQKTTRLRCRWHR
jgi:hypothetical protein